MIYVWGTKLYGEVDEVPGLGSVSTTFFHFMFVPLFPIQSFFVYHEGLANTHGFPIPRSNRSCFAAYAPFMSLLALVGMGFLGLFVGAIPGPGNHMFITGGVGALVGIFVAFCISRKVQKTRFADYETACEFANKFDDDRIQVYVHHHFKKLGDDEADQLIEKLTAARNEAAERAKAKSFGKASRAMDYPGQKAMSV